MARTIGAVLTLKDKDFSSNTKKASTATEDLQRKLKHGSNSVKNFGDSATSGFKRVGEGALSIAGAIGITKALSGAFNLVKDSVSGAMDRLDTLEQYERVMTTMTGDSDAAADSIERVKDIIEGTSMTTDVMTGSIQRFVTAGTDINKATDWVEAWGNATSFYGDGSVETFESVSDALAQMNSTGKVDMQQLNRIIRAGVPAIEIYADKTGESTESVKKSLSDGSIDAENFIDTISDALMEGTEKFPEVSTAMEDLGMTWGTVFQNIGSYASMGMAEVITAVDTMLEDNGLPTMREMVGRFGEGVYNAFEKAAGAVPIVTEKIQGMYDSAKPTLDWMKDTAFPGIKDGIGFAVDKATDMYNFIADNWPLIGPVVAGVAAAFGTYKIGIMAVSAKTAILKGATVGLEVATAILNGTFALSPMAWLALGIGAVVAIAIVLWKNWDTVKEKTQQLWSKFSESKAMDTVRSGMEKIGEAVEKVQGFFVGVKEKFDDFKSAIGKFEVPGWVSTIGGKISGAVERIREGPEGDFAVGTNRVAKDMVANIHKDEMIIPAAQSHNLRRQGVTINNIDKGGLNSVGRIKKASINRSANSESGTIAELKLLVKSLLQNNNKTISIAKLADSIVVREEADIEKFAAIFAKKLEDASFNMA